MNKNIINKLEYGISKQKSVTFNITECNWLLMLLEEKKELEQQDGKTLQALVKIRDEIDWIISTTNDELALARCKLILQYLNEVI